MKKRKCMADGGVIEQASRKVRQAVGGIADFLHVGKPAETTVLPPGRRGIPDNRPVVQDGMRSDMPQERYPRRFAEEVDQRKQARSGGYADGGIIPVDIRSGLVDAVVRPIADDWAQGNKAIKSIRNRYPTIDAAVGLHPVVAASQLANDVMSNDIGVDSAMNVLQAVPIVKRLSGPEKLLSKQSGPVVGGTKFVVDVPATVRKNVVLTGAQAIGQPGESFARGGIIPVRGKGTGTSDSIPAVLAGHEVRVSNGEGVAVLPAKTMRTPGALDAVEGIIAATNKRPPQPRTGGAGAYQTGVAGLVDDTAGRIVQSPAVTAPADGILAGIRDFASPTLPNMGPNLASAAAPPGTGQSQGFIGGADYSGGPDKNVGFVWSDGTPRVQPGQKGAVAPAAQAPGLLTMKERDIASGLDPNRAYRPGSAADPYASGIGAAATAQQSSYPADLTRNPLAAAPARRPRRQVGYASGGMVGEAKKRMADGGFIPVSIGSGLVQAIAQPIAEDWRLGNQAVKAIRDQHPAVDAIAGIHPAIAAAQVANDVMAGNVGADTAGNVAQMIPVVRQANLLVKGATTVPGVGRFSVNMPATIKKNAAITEAQTLGQPANAFANGGMVRFAGAGGPREDKIPVKVAGQSINVSDGEAAVILPAKTAANAAALGIIGQVIKATNDGREPKGGMVDGGEYAGGALPDEDELRRSKGQIGGAAFVRGDAHAPALQLAQGQIDGQPFVRPQTAAAAPVKPPITAPEMYAPAYQAIAQAPAAAQGIAGRVFDALPEGGFLKDPAIRQKLGSLIAGEGLRPDVGLLGKRSVPQQTSFSNEGRDSGIQARNLAAQAPPVASPPPVVAAKPAAAAGTADQASNRNGIVTSEMGRGFDPTKLTMAPGYGMASNAAGKTLSIGPSQYVAADGSQTSRWEDTQAYKDAIARNEADKMRLAEMQSRRLGTDPMAIQTARQGIAGALLANKAQEATMQQNSRLQSLFEKAVATTDPVQHKIALQNYLAARGINPRDSDEWEIKSGGQYTVPNGMGGIQVVERGPVAFHKPTQKWLTPDGSLSQGSQATQYTVTVGMPVQAEDGEHTFQGKTVIVKNGKVAEVK